MLNRQQRRLVRLPEQLKMVGRRARQWHSAGEAENRRKSGEKNAWGFHSE
jgi:hypothetical protein